MISLIILGAIIYFIIGRVIGNILVDNYYFQFTEDSDVETDKVIVMVLFPIILLFKFIIWIANIISNLITDLF